MLGRDETGSGHTDGLKKTKKGKNPRLAPFGGKEGFYTFGYIFWLGTDCETGPPSHQLTYI